MDSRATMIFTVVLSLVAVGGIMGCSSGPRADGRDSGQFLSSDAAPPPLTVSRGGEEAAPRHPAGAGNIPRIEKEADAKPASPPRTVVDAAMLDETVAIVRGEKITMRQLLEELLDMHGADLLDDLVTRTLATQEWKRLGITFSAQELEQRIDQEFALRRKELEDQTGAPDAFEAFLSLHGHTTESFRELLRTNENFANQIRLEHWFVLAQMTQDKVEVQHILVGTDTAAEEALEKIKKGADFAKLAQDKSHDTLTAANGGVLPPFFKGMGPFGLEFDEAAFALKTPGDLSGVVKSQAGYHVIKLLARIPGVKGCYKSLRPQIMAVLSNKLPDKRELRRWYENFRKLNNNQVEILFKKKD